MSEHVRRIKDLPKYISNLSSSGGAVVRVEIHLIVNHEYKKTTTTKSDKKATKRKKKYTISDQTMYGWRLFTHPTTVFCKTDKSVRFCVSQERNIEPYAE
jgi:hypothetical protein